MSILDDRRTETMTVRVSPLVRKEIDRISRASGLSKSATVEALIRRATTLPERITLPSAAVHSEATEVES